MSTRFGDVVHRNQRSALGAGTGIVLAAGLALGSMLTGIAYAQITDGYNANVHGSANAGASASGSLANGADAILANGTVSGDAAVDATPAQRSATRR
jgi:hypothetical protein